jgi:hypothetical protein
MTRSALLNLGMILAPMTLVCVAASSPARGSACTDPNAPPFLKNAQLLTTPYDPNPTNHNNALPSGSGTPPDQYCTSLQDAYNAASKSASAPFQQQLDALTNVFIDKTANCANQAACSQNAWGFRDTATNNTYVALPAGLWDQSTNQLPTYSQFEAYLVSALLGNIPVANLPITITPNSGADTQTMTVLAALAHEMGHIEWWWKYPLGPSSGGLYSFMCLNSSFPKYFADITWSYYVKNDPFRYFGLESSGNATEDGVDKKKLKKDLGNATLKNADLKQIYNGKWASIFATVAPDEDFVETYKLWALTTAQNQPLTSLTIGWQGSSPDVVSFLNSASTKLYKKSQWIQTCLAPWP